MNFLSEVPKAVFVIASEGIVDELLSRNRRNRTVKKSNVELLKAQIRDGRYCATNNGIGVDKHGTVIDGQHRLLALKESGYPAVPLLIVYGLGEDAQAAVDIGVKRQYSDLLQLGWGIESATTTTTAIARAWGQLNRVGMEGTSVTVPTPAMVAEWFIEILEPLQAFAELRVIRWPRFSAAVVAALCEGWRKFPEDTGKVVDFIVGVRDGANLEVGSPALVLRNWLYGKPRLTTGHAAQREQYDKTLNCLQSFIQGRLRFRVANGGRSAVSVAPARQL